MRLQAPRLFARLAGTYTGRALIVAVVLVVALGVMYTLAGFFVMPRLIAMHAPRIVQEEIGRRLSIGEIRLNPVLFTVEVKKFRLQEADGRPLVSFDRLFVDFEVTSVVRRAWTFADIQLDAPRVDAVLERNGRLNIAELLEALVSKTPPPEPPPPPRRILLQHAIIRGGVVAFTDLSRRAPQTAEVTPIDIEVQNITTVQDRRGPYAISATLTGGGVVSWEGEVSLYPMTSSGQLGLSSFPLTTAWRFVQDDFNLAEPGGRVDAKARYEVAYRDGVTSMRVEGVDVTVGGLALTARGESAPMLTMEQIRVAGVRGDLISRQFVVPEISVSRGRVAAVMGRDGVVNWQKLVVPPAAAPAGTPAPHAAEGKPWRVALESVKVDQVAMAVTDESRATPIAVDVGDVGVTLFAKLSSSSSGLTGTADEIGVKVSRIAVREAGAGKPALTAVDGIVLEGGRVDLAAQHVTAARVAVTGGATAVVRAPNGLIPLVAMFDPAAGAARPSPAPAARATPAPASKTWTVALAKVDLGGHRLNFTDQSVNPAAQLDLVGITVKLQNVRTDDTKPVPFEAAFDVAKGGRFNAKGTVAPDGSAAEATLTFARLLLTPTQSYITQFAAVVLRSGVSSTAGKMTYRKGRDRPSVTFTGSADIDDVRVVEAASGEPVISWKAMHADRVRFSYAPDRLEVAEVRLTNLDGGLVIGKDKSISVTKLMKTPPPAARAAAPASPPAADTMFPVLVERLRIEDASANFADQSLVLPFATRVHALNGAIVGINTKPGSRATVKLEGRVDEFGSVKIDGAVDAQQPKVFTDITVTFRNVAMPTLSPYSATFAGRRIQSGAMDLDLEYKIDRSALVGENKVVLRKLQLGERVESPGAMKLPLDLAIAILSDSDGVIDLAVPVRGNVDAPEFAYGAIIWQALVNVITKIATAPFRALAGLFRGGGDGERLENIAFEAGSDRIPPPERQKLQQVVEVLGKRPRLKLTVHGGYEAKVDGEALRSLRVREDLAKRLDVKLKPGEDPGPVAYDEVKTQRALEALLTDREGDKAVEAFQAGYEKSTGKKVERASRMLALVGRGGGDRAFYEAMFRRLVEKATVADTELTALGQRRADSTVRALKEAGGAASTRVEVGATEAVDRTERSGVPTRLELGASGA